jgi:tetratricopeptide (TPR) repeat protein
MRMRLRSGAIVLAVALGACAPGVALSGLQNPSASPAAPAVGKSGVTPVQAELNALIRAANAAQTSGNAAAIAHANRELAALALRIMAQIRLVEHAYPQAVELYQQSLQLADIPDTRTDLAIAGLEAKQPDLAIEQAQKALAADEHSSRTLLVLGQGYIDKQEFRQAAEVLTRAAEQKPDIETYYSLAICWLSTKDAAGKQQANAVFEHMKEMAGDSGSLHVLFGRAYRDADMMPEAIREFQRAIELDPSTPHAHYFLGLAYLSLNEWKPTPEVQPQFEKEVQYHPRDFLANYMLGFLASSERQYAVADKYLKAAAGIDPTWPEPYLYMGLNAYAQGDPKAAEPLLRKAVDLTGADESRGNYQIRRAYVDLGRILASSGREQESDAFIAKARELQNKTMTDSQQRTTALLLAEGGSGTMAAMVPLDKRQENQAAPLVKGGGDAFARVDAAQLEQAKLTPAQRDAAKSQEDDLRQVLGQSLSDLATAEAIQHDYGSALTHYQDAEKWNPGIAGLDKNLGQCAFRVKDYPEAARALSRAVASQPEDLPLRAMLGMSYFAMEKYGDAATAFYPLGVAGMQDGAVGYAWAESLAKTGDLKHASEVLTQYQGQQLPSDAILLAGQLWIEIGDYSQAVALLHHALESDPSLLKAHYYSGLADVRWEHWPDARTEFQAELALEPNDPDTLYHLGYVDLQESKIDDAAKLFGEVVAAHPDYANAQYELGKILLDRGQLADAVPHLESAAKLIPDKDYVHYQLQAAYRKEARVADADRELALYQELKAKARPHLPSSSAQGPAQNP